MKNLILLTVISFGIFALTGCGDAAADANSETAKTSDSAKTVLKPADVSTDKPVALKDLIEGVFADKDAWKNKEVAVTGYVSATSGSGGKFGYALTLKNDKAASSGDTTIGCYVPEGDIPKDIMGTTVEVKGTISFIRDEGKNVQLKPCELKK